MYVCMYMYMHICMCACTWICIYVYAHVRVYAYMYVCMYIICMYVTQLPIFRRETGLLLYGDLDNRAGLLHKAPP